MSIAERGPLSPSEINDNASLRIRVQTRFLNEGLGNSADEIEATISKIAELKEGPLHPDKANPPVLGLEHVNKYIIDMLIGVGISVTKATKK